MKGGNYVESHVDLSSRAEERLAEGERKKNNILHLARNS